MWVKAESVKTSGYSPGIFGTNLESGAASGFTLRYSFVDRKFNFFLGSTAGGYTASTTSITAGNWFHVVCTWDSSALKIYVNGTNEATDSTVSTLTAGTNLHVGTYSANTVRYFDGLIDEIGFWNRVLTSTEVSELYNSGAGIPYDAGGGGATFKPIVATFM